MSLRDLRHLGDRSLHFILGRSNADYQLELSVAQSRVWALIARS
ncbi:MAG: hypothetical protein JWR80_2240 [Bradyrhizobium sp.]|nr:hypothetical protein [Bradyrhizobium sp.]